MGSTIALSVFKASWACLLSSHSGATPAVGPRADTADIECQAAMRPRALAVGSFGAGNSSLIIFIRTHVPRRRRRITSWPDRANSVLAKTVTEERHV